MKQQVNIQAVIKLINSYEIEAYSNRYKRFVKDTINSKTRLRPFVHARSTIYGFLHSNGFGLEGIGLYFDKSGQNGAIDHTTVLHGLRKLKNEGHYPDFQEMQNKLYPLLQNCFYQNLSEPLEYGTNGFTDAEIDIMNSTRICELLAIKDKLIFKYKNFHNLATQKIHTLL